MIRRLVLPLWLVAGDLVALLVAMPVAVVLRFGLSDLRLLELHILPFTLLALISIVVFFSAGLYDKPTTVIRKELFGTILGAQIVNTLIAAVVFFFVPWFVITPRATLLLYLVISVGLVTLWRLFALSFTKTTKERAVVVGDAQDAEGLLSEFSDKGLVPFQAEFVNTASLADPSSLDDARSILKRNPAFVVVDVDNPFVKPLLAELDLYRARGGRLVGFSDFYERVFHRIPVSTLAYRNFFKEGELSFVESIFKRLFDILLSIPLTAVFLVCLPFVFIATRIEGKGPLFIAQERIGKDWRRITVYKFRTMRFNKSASREWTVEEVQENPVTNVGAFLRRSSIDELPQVFSVLVGDLSLVGPRSDIVGLGERLQEEIPSYRARYAVTPGISGWAQVNQRYAPGNISPQSIEETKVRLAYDLYYVKHRSPFLDISITLRTLKTLIVRLFP